MANGPGIRRTLGELFRFLSFIWMRFAGTFVLEDEDSLRLWVERRAAPFSSRPPSLSIGSGGSCSSPAPDRALVRGCRFPPHWGGGGGREEKVSFSPQRWRGGGGG